MQRCEINAIFNSAQDFIGNQNGLLKLFAAMHDTMPDGMDVCDALNFFDS